MNSRRGELLRAVRDARSVLVCTHRQPDGDAIGSLLALGEMLNALGKSSTLACHDPVPASLRFLPGEDRIVQAEALAGLRFDLGIAVDCTDTDRLGGCAASFFSCAVTAQMDHHATNSLSVHISEIDTGAPAAGSMVFRLCEEAGVAFSTDMAVCLYTAISTDTGNFCFGPLTEETFRQMSVLMRSGLPIVHTARMLHLTRQQRQVCLLGRALVSLSFHFHGRFTRMQLTASDLAACDAGPEHAEGIVNYGLYIPGVEISCLAVETPEGTRCSLRCLPPHDVAAVALAFGGGGHTLASGCLIRESMDATEQRMNAAILPLLVP